MNNRYTEDKGITLITAVVSIIVLLIIAGISMSGIMNGGTLSKSKEASHEYGRATVMDDIKIDIIAVQKKNNGKMTEDQFYETVQKYGSVDVKDIETGYLTTSDGKYKISLKELYDGEFAPASQGGSNVDDGGDGGENNHGNGGTVGGGGNGGTGDPEEPTTPEDPEVRGFYVRYYPNVYGSDDILVLSNINTFNFSKVTSKDSSLSAIYTALQNATNYNEMVSGTLEYYGYYPWQGYDISYVITIGNGLRIPTLKGFFSGCKNLYHVDLSGCDLSSCTDASYMFAQTNNLNISKFDVDMSAVRDMSYMFSGNSDTEIDEVRYLDTSKVTNLKGMFKDCSRLRGNDDIYIKTDEYISDRYTSVSYFDLTSFDVSKVTNFSEIFDGTNSLQYVSVNKKWKDNSKAQGIWTFLKSYSEKRSQSETGNYIIRTR